MRWNRWPGGHVRYCNVRLLWIYLLYNWRLSILVFLCHSSWLLVRFLCFNLPHKNKVFMGDTGSLFLGFVFYLFTMYFVTNESVIFSVFIPHKSLLSLAALCVFFVPILDSGSVFFSRVWHKKSPFKPDNNHIHHLVLHFTKNHVMASLLIVAVLTATLMLFSQLAFILTHEITMYLFFIYIFIWYVVLFFIRRKVRKKRHR